MRKRHYFFLFFVLAAALCEIGARMAQPWLIRSTPAYYYRQYLSALVKGSPVLVWAGKPEAQADIANSKGERIHYKLNALGWRDKDFQPFEMPGNALVLGDSFTFGLGVKAEDRYTEKLEAGFRGLNLWNLGVMGYAPDQYLLLAERWVPPMPWNFVLIQLSNNDVADVAQHTWKGVNSFSGIPAALDPPFSHTLVTEYSEAWNLLVYFGVLGAERLPEPRLEDGLKRLLFSLREIAKLCRERKIPLLMLQASDWGEPAYGKKIADDYKSGVIALAKEQGFGLLDVGAVDLLPFPDLHWSVAGHHKVAEMLVPAIHDIIFPAKAAPPVVSGKKRTR